MVNLKISIILLLGCLVIFSGCDNKKAEKLDAELKIYRAENKTLKKSNRDLAEKLEELKADTENQKILIGEETDWAAHLVKSIGPSLWSISQYDNPLPYKLFKTATPDLLIKELNLLAIKMELPEVVIVIIKDKTAYVKVIDDNHLTQGMGTSGAAAFLKSVAYTLTSINTIKCVEFEFSAGDHAYPTELCP